MKIRRLSNTSVGISINPAFLKVAGLKENDDVEMCAEKGMITIKKIEEEDQDE